MKAAQTATQSMDKTWAHPDPFVIDNSTETKIQTETPTS